MISRTFAASRGGCVRRERRRLDTLVADQAAQIAARSRNTTATSRAPMAVPLGLDSPLKQSIFAAYVFLWVASALLVYASKQSGAPPYNATSVVVLTELAKLGLALALYRYYDGTWLQLGRGTVAAWWLLLKYMVPAGLYAVYNNLMYINLTNFDPGTYTLMMQLRILFTGLLYQALFARCAARRASDPRAASAARGPRRLLTPRYPLPPQHPQPQPMDRARAHRVRMHRQGSAQVLRRHG